MKYVFQFARILGFCFLGEALRILLPFPIPSSIYGLVALLLALKMGLVKLEQVQEAGNFLTGIFALLFIPAAVGVMELFDVMLGNIIVIVLAVVVVTAVVMTVSGLVTQAVSGLAPQAVTSFVAQTVSGLVPQVAAGKETDHD